MTKIIFLDIDGVLNCNSSDPYMPNGYVGIDEDKLQNLKYIVDQTGAEIYLTSTWKHGWSPRESGKFIQDDFGNEIDFRFSAAGLQITNKTYEGLGGRGDGIYHVLITLDPAPEGWVVLDDEYWPDFPIFDIDTHFVKTEWYGMGLTKEKADLAIQILNNEIEMQYDKSLFTYRDHIGKE